MSQQKADCFVFMEYGYNADWSKGEWHPHVWGVKVDESDRRIFLRHVFLDVDVPDDWNPIPQQVAALELEKQKALDEYQRTVSELNERLAKLLALTNEVIT